MNEIAELKAPIDVINPHLDDNIDSFPEKTRRTKENLAKYGIPKAWQEKEDSSLNDTSFWIHGILNQADAATNTVIIVEKAVGNSPETAYTITSMSAEVLAQLVKSYWNSNVKVHIKPKMTDKQSNQYELIEALH